MSDYPAAHFPSTPRWAQEAVRAAIKKVGVLPAKWQVPLEAIGRYESNYNPGANICENLSTVPIGLMQLTRKMYMSAESYPKLVPGIKLFDPVQANVVAILYITSKLSGYGGYGTIEKLLERTDRGPGDVLRAWIKNPNAGVETLRPFYHGY